MLSINPASKLNQEIRAIAGDVIPDKKSNNRYRSVDAGQRVKQFQDQMTGQAESHIKNIVKGFKKLEGMSEQQGGLDQLFRQTKSPLVTNFKWTSQKDKLRCI